MTAIAVILIFVVVAVSLLYPNVIGARISLSLMIPVLVYVAAYLIDWSVPNLPATALNALIGMTLGVCALVVLLPLSSNDPRVYLQQSLRGLPYQLASLEGLKELTTNSFYILYEELIWRVFLVSVLTMLTTSWIAVPIAALLFWYSHEANRELSTRSCEFLLFSLFITTIYAITESLTIIICIHFARNILILAQAYGETQVIPDEP